MPELLVPVSGVIAFGFIIRFIIVGYEVAHKFFYIKSLLEPRYVFADILFWLLIGVFYKNWIAVYIAGGHIWTPHNNEAGFLAAGILIFINLSLAFVAGWVMGKIVKILTE